MKKIMFLLLTITLLIGMVVPQVGANSAPSFSDLPSSHWAHRAIMNMTNQGYLSGYPNGTFGPQRNISRAEFTSVVVRVMGISGGNSTFTDVSSSYWASSGINAAVNAGVIVPSEYGSRFDPNTPITRLEMAKMLARGLTKDNEQYAAYLKTFGDLYNGDLPFVDYREFQQKEVPFLAMAFGSGIMSGYPDASFGLDRRANRAEAAVMLSSFIRALGTDPADVQYLNELKEVAETGMNATAVSDVIPQTNLVDEVLLRSNSYLTAEVKRVYVIPTSSDVVSLYERKFLWDRTQILERNISAVDGFVAAIVEITFKSDQIGTYAYGRSMNLTPGGATFYNEPAYKYNFISEDMRGTPRFAGGESYQVVLYGNYNSENTALSFVLSGSGHTPARIFNNSNK